MPTPSARVAVFDLGGVLIDWNPRYLYRKLFAGDVEGMEKFLREVCTGEWNERQDEGRPWAEAVASLTREHPEMATLIEAYCHRWSEMLNGAIPGAVALLERLRAQGVPLYSITNWSHETFGVALERFEFLGWFRDIVVSGRERTLKPRREIYEILLRRNTLPASECLFIDDVERNVTGAKAVGMQAVRFVDPETLEHDLTEFGLLR